MTRLVICTFFTLISLTSLQAQQKELDNRVNLVFGVSQLLANGFNIEGNLFYKRLAFDYSHGVSLNFSNELLGAGPDQDQGLALHLPYTTGFGVGYRINEWLNIRVEPKWHRYELFYEGDVQNESTLIDAYTTFTLGLGAYANLRPFKNQDNFLKGIMIAPNVRYWPKVSSTLPDDQFTYLNRNTEQIETHQAREVGIANTPFFFNASIGYSVKF